jgi:TolB-like protein/tetratricopeptide (TPR) repeat protein
MPDENHIGFFGELKRRNVFRVAIAYLVVAWLTLQIVDVLVPMLDLPESAGRFVFLLLIVGLPIALIFAWAFEMTPDGIKLEKHVDRSTSITPQTGRKLNIVIIGALTVALGFSLYLHWDDDESLIESVDAPEFIATTGRQSIAVLPFANRSANDDDEFFVDGVHDDLLTKLAKISSLKVISRTSVMQYRDTEKNMRTIGEELGVKTLLEGGIQRAGDLIRINVQLINAETDEHIWAETYNTELTAANIFEIQETISSEISGALRVALTSEEQSQITARPTENLQAYEAYLQGRQRMRSRTVGDLNAAREHFRRAISIDDDFALAHVGLAETAMILNTYGGMSMPEMMEIAGRAIERAFEINDQLGEAYSARGGFREYTRDYLGAEQDYLRSIELAPGFTTGYHWYGLVLLDVLGEREKAADLFRQAAELDPLAANIRANYAWALYATGSRDAAIEEAERALELDAGQLDAGALFATDHAWTTGNLAESMHWNLKLVDADPFQTFNVALGYLLLGEFETAAEWLAYSKANDFGTPNGDVVSAMISLAQFQNETAGAIADNAIENTGDTYGFFLAVKASAESAIRRGEQQHARDVIVNNWPELSVSPPNVHPANVHFAITLAAAMTDIAGARNELLVNSRRVLQDMPEYGEFATNYYRAKIHALLGENDAAILELRRAIDNGWRGYWVQTPHLDPGFATLHGDTEFMELMDEVQALIAIEVEKVRQMEASGTLPSVPE